MKNLQKLRILMFFLILLIPVLFMNYKKEQVSEIDNRNLVEFSDVRLNESVKLDSYIQDRIGFRTSMINVYNKYMDKYFGYMVHPNYQNGQEGYVFQKVTSERYDEEFLGEFSDFIKGMEEYCNERDIKFLYAVEPSKSTVYTEYLPDGYAYENNSLNVFLSKLNEKEVNYIFTGEALINAKDQYQVFDKKYDANHWNETGAIIGISEIINEIKALEPSTIAFNINNYNVETQINTTLPVSYFEIHEETLTYDLKNNRGKANTEYRNKIKISPNYNTFVYVENEYISSAPRVLVFAGSYFNSKEKFFLESFSEYIRVQSYHNVLNYDYYINLFNPDVVLFESTEYTHESSYFPLGDMINKSYNKAFNSFTDLVYTANNIALSTLDIEDNGAVIDVSYTVDKDDGEYYYIKVLDRMLDCIFNEEDEKYEVSIASKDINKGDNITIYKVYDNKQKYSTLEIIY